MICHLCAELWWGPLWSTQSFCPYSSTWTQVFQLKLQAQIKTIRKTALNQYLLNFDEWSKIFIHGWRLTVFIRAELLRSGVWRLHMVRNHPAQGLWEHFSSINPLYVQFIGQVALCLSTSDAVRVSLFVPTSSKEKETCWLDHMYIGVSIMFTHLYYFCIECWWQNNVMLLSKIFVYLPWEFNCVCVIDRFRSPW